jgi:hypothetical protein
MIVLLLLHEVQEFTPRICLKEDECVPGCARRMCALFGRVTLCVGGGMMHKRENA